MAKSIKALGKDVEGNGDVKIVVRIAESLIEHVNKARYSQAAKSGKLANRDEFIEDLIRKGLKS